MAGDEASTFFRRSGVADESLSEVCHILYLYTSILLEYLETHRHHKQYLQELEGEVNCPQSMLLDFTVFLHISVQAITVHIWNEMKRLCILLVFESGMYFSDVATGQWRT